MSKTSDGTKDQPQFASSGNAPTFAADLTLLSDFFAARSNRRFTTAALLLASSGSGTDDWAVATNAPGAYFRWNGSGWDMFGEARFASAAARDTALTAPGAGWKVYRTDTKMSQMYDGTRWRYLQAGLIPVIPASVAGTGVTLGAGGLITFATATALSANGCFTGEFENYLIVTDVSAKSGASSATFKFRAAGSDLSGASDYGYEVLASTGGTTTTGGTTAAASFELASSSATRHRIRSEVFAPFPARSTGFQSSSNDADSTTASAKQVWGDYHPTTVIDGFSIIFSANNATGKARVYGYNDN